MRKAICVLLALWLMLSTLMVSAQQQYAWGDLDNSGKVDAGDALLVLKYAVGKINLSDEALAVANVSATGAIDAADALMILQFSVGKLNRFPADTGDMTEQELYYYQRDLYYGVNGSDFTDVRVSNADDAKEVVNTLGDVPENSDIDTYEINSEGNVVYNRISREAKAQGTLNLYNTAEKTKGSFTLDDGTVFTYEVPTAVTAYTAVPIQYTVQGGGDAMTVQVEGTTWEEPDRVPDTLTKYYENTMPDDVSVGVEYNGYVQAVNNDSTLSSSWSELPQEDRMGTVYPAYETTDLIESGTIPANLETWLKFTVTNTGNTILKGDGQGYFNFCPRLYKKGENGVWNYVAMNDNYAYRLYDALYPGETKEIWVKFGNGGYGAYPAGEYKMILENQLANEQTAPGWTAMYVGGRTISESSFTFTVSDNAAVTTPKQVVTQKTGTVVRNTWLGVYEEFQTSYHTHWVVDTKKPEKDTLYVQPAPWDTTLTLRVISEDTGVMEMVTLPLQVESDSISIALNPYNEHYVITEEGTREPILATQHMADMRGNNQDSPYPMEVLVNDCKDMQEAGINYLTSTMAFNYTVGVGGLANTATRIMMDYASLLGFKFEGYGNYTYESSINHANITRRFGGINASFGNNKVNGILNNWIYARFGDVMWSNPGGVTPIAQEDSRGWLTIDHDWRMDIGEDNTVAAYQQWLKEAYGTIEKLNQAYGSEYSDFSEIDPRQEALPSDGYYNFTPLNEYTNVFYERSRAVRDLDLFRTVKRVWDYRESLALTTVPGAKMTARYEGSPIITVGLKADTKNMHYRETYYQMQRSALVGEVLAAADDEIYGTSTYQNTAYTAAETYELTKHATQNGLSVMNYHMHYRDQIYTNAYGDGKADTNLHLADSNMKVTAVNTASALFPALKATYEAGGIPAVMWMDYFCSGFVTSTMYKELQFYTQKIQEMLATEEGQKWATDFDAAGSTVNDEAGHVWSYDPEYLAQAYENTPRWDKFNLNRNK